MQTLDVLDDNTRFLNQRKVGFWSRQFSSNVTSAQLIFDVIVGVIAPILCFIFDPIIFNDSLNLELAPHPIARYKLFVYLFSAVSIVTLSLFLTQKIKSGRLRAIIAGILLSGALCSLAIGIIILPFSVLGLIFFFIGILGFTPFLTAFVYLRNAVRAVNAAKPVLAQRKLMAMLALGGVLVSGPCLLLQVQIERVVTQSMNDLLRGDIQAAQSATENLRYFAWTPELDEIVLAYSRETDATRRESLAKVYLELTGSDIENRLAKLRD